jgi:SAM-dependent methyltransferase
VSAESASYWDGEADRFDEAPDHGLRDPAVRAAWRGLLLEVLPPTPSDVIDLGCGTGSLALLAAEAGHRVTGVDFAPRMLAEARAKADAAGLQIAWHLGDAAAPPLAPGTFDVVLERHVLWAMPDPAAALEAWSTLLKPGGVLVLVEGRWWTGGGLAAGEVERMLETMGRTAATTPLPDPALWGAPTEDERYLVVSRSRL